MTRLASRSFKHVVRVMIFASCAAPLPATAQPVVERVLRGGVETGIQCDVGAPPEVAAWDISVAGAGEARSEGPLGMALAMETMINRACVNHWSYGGGSIRGVLLYPFAYSIFNQDSAVRDDLLAMMANPNSGPRDIRENAKIVYPIALAILRGWRTGLLETSAFSCRHYKTLTAKAKWAKRKPDLVYKSHEFYCSVDTGIGPTVAKGLTLPVQKES